MLYIGVDLGTTCCKACLYDSAGKLLSSNSIAYPLITHGEFIEQDANVWYQAVKDNIAALMPFAHEEIAAVSFSTQGISFVPVNCDGEPLCNAISWLDRRGESETKAISDVFGEKEIYNRTGKPLSSAYTLPKLIWFAKHRPDLYSKAYKLLMPLDFLNFALTGKAVTDLSMASGTMLYNIHDKCWDKELLRFSGISPDKLPEVLPAGESIGKILPQAAKDLGLSENVSVIMGGQDQKIAAIGAGIQKDVCTVSIGTATAISKLNPDANTELPLFAFNHTMMFAETSLPTTGAAISWLSQILNLSYEEMDALAEHSVKGAGGVRFNIDLSVKGSFKGLTLGTEKSDIIRSLYEGIAEEIAKKIDSMGGAKQLRIFGGGSNSDILNKIIAETVGAEVCVMDTAETATLGAVMLASGGEIGCANIRRRFTC